MRRCILWLTVVAPCLGLMGCQKPYFMTELDYAYYNRVSGEYNRAEYTDQDLVPVKEPRTVRDPGEKDKIPWKLTLEEVKKIAILNNKQIAFQGYIPGQQGTLIDLRLSAFDPYIQFGGGWSNLEQQVLSNIQVLGTGRDAINQKLFGNTVANGPFGFNTTYGGATQDVNSVTGAIPGADLFSILKRNATGGFSSISYTLGYQNINPVNVFTALNPSWSSAVNLNIQQPLLQGAGIEFNRAPILIARANHEQSIKEFQTQVNTMLRDVEIAYWQIYFAYQDLYSREQGMRQALATWQKEKNRQEVGTGAVPDVAQAREQYEFFRAARLQALQRTLSAERDLRRLMGLPPDDDRRIIPADEPTVAEYQPSWQIAVLEMMETRPELSAQRYVIRASELEVFRQKNGLLPDLTFGAGYSITGLDNQWDQSIDTLTNGKYTTWTLNGRYRQQIGERSAHASVRRAQLTLGQQRATLRNLEHTFLCDLHEAYQNLISFYELIQAQKDRREAAAQQLVAREQFYLQGKTTIDVLLQAQTTFADALRDEAQAVVQYNQAVARWEFAKGTIINNDNVILAEEGISRMKEKHLRERVMQWDRGLPMPIHPGKKVHTDFEPCPDTSLPLYPDYLFIDPPRDPNRPKGDAPPLLAPPAEMEPRPTGPVLQTTPAGVEAGTAQAPTSAEEPPALTPVKIPAAAGPRLQ